MTSSRHSQRQCLQLCFAQGFKLHLHSQVSGILWGGFSNLEMPVPTSSWCCQSSKALEEPCLLRRLDGQKSKSCLCDDIWLLSIWNLKGSGIIFCKNSAESCYSVQGLRETLGIDTGNTLLGDLLKYNIEIEQTMGRLELTH